jgi:hypothetical protein
VSLGVEHLLPGNAVAAVAYRIGHLASRALVMSTVCRNGAGYIAATKRFRAELTVGLATSLPP